ncbi:MAG: hypothetical protein H0T79_21500, partial [Deltaproteobacteria bacterium]|nr:hypothetical protein [Deltaproteobacteria bacterium]
PPNSPELSGDEVSGQPKPYSCGNGAFSAVNDAAMNISLAQTHGSAALLGVPSHGGSLLGYTLQNGKLVGAPTKLRTDEQLTSTASTFVEDYIVSASATADGSVLVDVISGDLTQRNEVGKVEGTGLSKLPVLHADGAYVLPTTDAQGLHLNTFDANWSLTSSQLFSSAKPPTGLSGVNMGDEALIAWSAAGSCNLHVVGGGTVTSMTQSYACDNPRLAADVTKGIALMVFDSPEGVKIAGVSHGSLGRAWLLRGDVSSPRIAFDGTHFWMSFIDLRGQVIVGYLDSDTMDLTSTALSGMSPERDGFELSIVDGKPWVFAANADGYAAHRICVY